MCLPAAVACLCAAVCGILESSAGVGVGDDRGAQSEQGGQEMGNQGGQRAQEYHSLQASKRDTHTHIHIQTRSQTFVARFRNATCES